MQKIFVKPKDMTYTALCIWIDENIYKEDCDMNKVYEYLWLLSYMLACKKRYFNTEKDYEEFSSMFAYSTYQRMTNTSKSKVKSVLNYMKSTISFRRMTFEASRRQEIIDPFYSPTFDSTLFSEQYKSNLESSNRQVIIDNVNDLIKTIPHEIKKNIPKIYRGNKVEYNNIYISSLLTMLNKFTIPENYENIVSEKLSSPTFNEVKYYKKHLDNEVVLWHLDPKMETVIRVIINKVSRYIISEVQEISGGTKYSEEEFSGIMSSVYSSGGSNETDY